MKKKYRNFEIAIIVIPVIAIIVATWFNVAHVKPQPTEEEYNLLKDYSLYIASGTPIEEIEKNGVKATKEINEEFIEVTVTDEKCKVITSIVLSEANTKIENGKLYIEKSIEYDKIDFFEESLIDTKFEIILLGISFCMVWIATVFIIGIGIPKTYRECLEKEAQEKSKK